MLKHETYSYDVAISAVPYDTLLVADVSARLTARLGRQPVWTGAQPRPAVLTAPPLHEDVSRIALMLVQRLWGRDDVTVADATVLEARARRQPASVVVVSLDDEPLPRWMAPLQRCALATSGIDGISELVLDAFTTAGGSVSAEAKRGNAAADPAPRWALPPTPFLGQPRAHTALRRELDALCAELEPRFEVAGQESGDHIVELHRMPHRIVARVDDIGLSFSWVPGRTGTVADGRLMVIQWHGLAAARGVRALRTARSTRECVYSAEASGVDDWCWRADAPNSRASSTANLVGEWMACASLKADAAANGGAP